MAKKILISKTNKLGTIFVILGGMILFIPLFTINHFWKFDFWAWMSLNLIFLISISLIIDKDYQKYIKNDFKNNIVKKIILGLISAVVLYLVFYFGDIISNYMFKFAESGIQNVYAFKGESSNIRILFLMLIIIGPGEELFWRGYIQRNLSLRYGKYLGFAIAASTYTFVHLFTGNIMLILSALIAGLFWGWLLIKYDSMIVNIISHTIWDICVFVLFPFN